jgi:[acyl-carrier-protein] S-malonyltransferase
LIGVPDQVSTGIVFPGMGPSGYAELGKFVATNPYARRLRRIADQVLGYPLMDRYREAIADYSEYSQIAFLVSCLAHSELAAEVVDMPPAVCTGPSFGEKSAVAYSGALSIAETILLTARLVRCEEEYFQGAHQDVVTQSVARLPGDRLAEIRDAMTRRHEWSEISCHIDEDFQMVSLGESSLDRFIKDVRSAGGLPLYAMRPPMHSSAFGVLRRKIEDEVLGDFPIRDPRIPVVADQDGSVVTTAAGVRAMLLDSFVRPVRWPDVVKTMQGLGITTLYISGPDSLFGRVRCTTQNFAVATNTSRIIRKTVCAAAH